MRDTVRLVAGGDIMLGEHPIMVGRGVGTALGRDPDFDLFGGIRNLLGTADLATANLECALSDPPRFSLPSRRECRGPVRGIHSLTHAGFHALSLANNHSQQYGREAFDGTVASLDDAGIRVVGRAAGDTGRCLPVDLQVNGLDLRVLGYSLRPRQHFTGRPQYAEGPREAILHDIGEARAAGALAVVSIHWGDEFVASPTREQVDLGHAMIEAGCSLVIGHHPHVLQGWERVGSGVILYSLGNFVFDMPWQTALRRAAVCEITLSKAGCGDVTWHPITQDGRYRPVHAAGLVGQEILSFLEAARRDLERGEGEYAAQDPEAHERLVAWAGAQERRARYRYFARNLWRYRADVTGEVLLKFALRRLGLLHD
ncbi:MAG: CapA family protein [bacterium]|nr:CapA family protein [bacterium]